MNDTSPITLCLDLNALDCTKLTDEQITRLSQGEEPVEVLLGRFVTVEEETPIRQQIIKRIFGFFPEGLSAERAAAAVDMGILSQAQADKLLALPSP